MEIRASIADDVDLAAMRCYAQRMILHSRTSANVAQDHDLHAGINLEAIGGIFVFREESISRFGRSSLVFFSEVFFIHIARIEVRVCFWKCEEQESTNGRSEDGHVYDKLP